MQAAFALVAGALGAALVLCLASLASARARLRSLEAQTDDIAQSVRRPDEPLPEGPDTAASLRTIERGVAELQRDRHGAEAMRERLERALSAIPQGVVVLDHAGNPVFVNPTASAFESARHGDALVGAAVDELIDEVVGGEPGVRTVDLFGPPKRVLVISATPLFEHEEQVGSVAVIDDISERIRVDTLRRDFIANISHELKTPVGAITLLAETLLQADDDPQVTERLAERILAEALRVGRTIEDLLELSRIETEEAPTTQPVVVSDAVCEAVDRIRPAAEHAGIPVATNLDDDLYVEGDRRQITSAIYNLLDNALKYSDRGSPVTVSSRAVDRSVELAVEDRGIGIPARDIERVFERFYRVDQARSRETGGTGLGLAIVRHVAGNHAGDVRVESRLGEGSTFTLRLPRLFEVTSPRGSSRTPASNDATEPSSPGAARADAPTSPIPSPEIPNVAVSEV